MTDLGLSWEQSMRRINAGIASDISDVLWWDEESIHLRPFEDVPEEARWITVSPRTLPGRTSTDLTAGSQGTLDAGQVPVYE